MHEKFAQRRRDLGLDHTHTTLAGRISLTAFSALEQRLAESESDEPHSVGDSLRAEMIRLLIFNEPNNDLAWVHPDYEKDTKTIVFKIDIESAETIKRAFSLPFVAAASSLLVDYNVPEPFPPLRAVE